MEQYYMPKELDFENLRYCINNYTPIFISIAKKYSGGGEVKISEYLDNKTLDFQQNLFGLDIIINSKIIHNFPLQNYQKGFAVEYMKTLEKDKLNTTFKTVLDNHFMFIKFDEKISLTNISKEYSTIMKIR